jgi:hypothetical protein
MNVDTVHDRHADRVKPGIGKHIPNTSAPAVVDHQRRVTRQSVLDVGDPGDLSGIRCAQW